MTKQTKLTDLIPDARNANKGTQRGLTALDNSLRKYGAGRSILIDRNNKIIAGNKTQERAVDIGLDENVIIVETDGTKIVAVKRTDLDLDTDPAARELAYYDNRVGQLDLDWDIPTLEFDLSQGLDLDGLFSEFDLKAMGIDTNSAGSDAEPQLDRASELQEKWQVQSGELFEIGTHRLICGDCTDAAIVARLMGGEKAEITFTSPPYNAGISAQLSGNTSIDDNLYKDEYDDNKSQPDYLDLLNGFTDIALSVSDYVFINIQVLSGNKSAFLDFLHEYSDRFCDIAIWDKEHAAPQLARRVMDSRFEFIVIIGGNGSRAIGTREFRGMVHNVYSGSPQRNNEYSTSHAATFPLHLPSHFIETFTNLNERVYEPFAGTGTTLVACENLSRRGRGIEISPAYCAVVLERMTTAFPGLEITRNPHP